MIARSMASNSPARSPVFAWLAKWNDRPYRVELPAGISLNDPKRSELLTEVFYVSSGPRLFVHAIERKLAARLGIEPGDWIFDVNGVRPKDAKHFASLVERRGSEASMCLFVRPGFKRFGQPILMISGLIMLCFFVYELTQHLDRQAMNRLRENLDAREL